MRPFVVLQLLYFLIERNHEFFRDKGDIQHLRQKMREAVEREYPETEGHLPEDERDGHVPASILETLRPSPDEDDITEERLRKMPRLFNEKTRRQATRLDHSRSVWMTFALVPLPWIKA